MANKLTDGVGKKIVEALKQQSDIEIQQVVENPVEEPYYSEEIEFVEEESTEPVYEAPSPVFEFEQNAPVQLQNIPFKPVSDSDLSELDGADIPQNVAVLKQLITKLPAGVNKHTGAQIIRQTMEALGISMKNVLQEAQSVQEGLNSSSAQCQANIAEYKRQIGILENQTVKIQKQYAALNDIISLFVQA